MDINKYQSCMPACVLFSTLPFGVLLYNADGKLCAVNRMAEAILGLNEQQLIELHPNAAYWHVIDETGRPVQDAEIPPQLCLKTGKTIHNVVYGLHVPHQPEMIWINIHAIPLSEDEGKQLSGVYVVFEEITEKKRMEQGLENILNSIGDGFFACDERWDIIYMNPQLEKMLSVSAKNLIGKNFWQAFPDVIGTDREVAYKNVAKGATKAFEHYYVNQERWFHYRCYPRLGGGICVYMLDVTQGKRMETLLRNQAYTDSLTGLFSRGHFMALAETELQRAVRYTTALSMLMLDIDYFKQINDSYGHKVGDQVLKLFALVCRRELRDVDLIGRIGGEEFAVLLPQTNQTQALEVAQRLCNELAKASLLTHDKQLVTFTVSVGVLSLNPAQFNTIDSLLMLADQAMYEAKSKGRNRVCLALPSC